jgi:hypothetical protein
VTTPHRSTIRTAALVTALVLALAACGSGGSSGDSASKNKDTTTTTAKAGPKATGTLARYAGYKSVSYTDPKHWVCRPDNSSDICQSNLDATKVDADGTLTVEKFTPAADPKIDCFYVYPTISKDPGMIADWNFSPDEEGWVTLQQAARLRSRCRVFAPVYRQITFNGLSSNVNSKGAKVDRNAVYGDVLDAFKTYMAQDNKGRGIVLIGHSQGAGMLAQLLKTEFDPNKDVRAQLVGAYLAGGGVGVPKGKLIGGDLKNIPLCSSDAQAGCVTTWASFRSTAMPPSDTFFGKTRTGTGVAGCVNPADPKGSGDTNLDGYFPAARNATIVAPHAGTDLTQVGAKPASEWVKGTAGTLTTPFVHLTDLNSGECVMSNGAHVLKITVHGNPSDPRADDIGGDLTPQWGLHLQDINLTMGDIVQRVTQQEGSWSGN